MSPPSGPQSPQGSSFPSTPQSLQAMPARSAPSTAYSASNQPPAVPHVSTDFQQYENNQPRPTTMSATHSYSRSSPAVPSDQKYTPFSHTPESSRYPSASSSKHFIPQTPTGAPSQSPLALTDIRPRTELHLGDDIASPHPMVNHEPPIQQTMSNYIAPWNIYAFDWCKWSMAEGAGAGKMAICSYLEDAHNFIQILDTDVEQQDVSNFTMGFSRIAEATCSYPVTRILWEPPSSQKQTTDLLATSGDHLRLWSLPNDATQSRSNTIHPRTLGSRRPSPTQKLTPLALLSNSKTPEHTAPLTSLDWNKVSPKLIITSSIDTTCTIWDIPTLTAKTQLIAHDKEVFDVRFCAGSVDTFVSCGADGSVRMFDLRSLEHSTIIYEPSEKNDKGTSIPTSPYNPAPTNTLPGPSPGALSPGTTTPSHVTHPPPLLRLAASPHDSHLLATFAADSRVIRILDHRQPGQALLELHGHNAPINTVEWSPNRRGILASGADDSQVLYWDLVNPGAAAQIAPAQNGGFMSPVDGVSAASGVGVSGNAKGPAAAWRCDLEVGNVSWSPRNGAGSEWVGVTGGRGVWGVRV